MKLHHPHLIPLSAALAATLALAGCQDGNEQALEGPPVAATEPADTTLEPDPTATPEMPGDAAAPADAMADYEPSLTGTGPTALDITSVALGTEAGPDDTIAMPTNTFATDDDIVVAIDTDGAASDAQIAARLVYEDGQVAGEQSETISTTGADTTLVTFDNTDAWPAGNYKVEVLVNGTTAETAELTVQ